MKEVKRFLQNIRFSLQGLGSNKMTSFLTLLGIVIGIGSVIGLMSLGQGTQESIVSDLEDLGTDIVTISAGANMYDSPVMSENADEKDFNQGLQEKYSVVDESIKLTIDDYNFLGEEGIENVRDVSFTIISLQDIYLEDEESAESYSVVGTNTDLFDIYNFECESGSGFVQADIDEGNLVAVVGSEVLEEYVVGVGDVLNIGGVEFEVVGVLVEQEDSLLGSSPSVEIYIPFSVVDEIGGDSDSEILTRIILRVEDDGVLDQTILDIEERLMEFRDVEEMDFSIFSIQTLVDRVRSITETFTLLLTGIAAISLLVGGIGISNVMLITVSQRTREIGIRKAVGGRRSDILVQFLSEAVFLTLIGGVVGMGFGILIGDLAERFLGLSAVITLDSVILAVGISVGIGILFGILPANKASRLSPIEALRYE
ncbi:ABC transporter permease [bacterium]|nr:ABC transporter permease [bacterium]